MGFTLYDTISGDARNIVMTGTGKWIKHTASFFYGVTNTRSIIFGGTFAASDDEFYIDGVKIWAEHNHYPDKLIIGSDPPATASSTGIAGTITYDSDYVYVAVANDTWKRAEITTWAVSGGDVV